MEVSEPQPQQGRDLFVHPPAALPDTGLYANSWAVVIGVNRYSDPRIPALRFAESDAEAFASRLPLVGFPPENITLLRASREREKINQTSIFSLLYRLQEKMKQDDQFLFYFAGHGVTSLLGDKRRGYLLLPDSSIGGAWPSQQCPYLEDVPGDAWETVSLRAFVDGLRPRHKLVILDACFSGLIMQPRSLYAPLELSPNTVKAWRNKYVTQLLTAGGAGEQALESDRYGHGIFTHFLLNGLDDGVRPGQEIIPATEISSYVRERVSAESPQNPQSQNDGEGEFLFVRKPVRSKQAQIADFRGVATAALDRGDLAAAESAIHHAEAIAGEVAELKASIEPLAVKFEAAQTAARVAALIAEAGKAVVAGQLSLASAKATEAEKLAVDPAHSALIAQINKRIATATAEEKTAGFLRDAEAALAFGNWKTAAAKLVEGRKVCPPELSSFQQALDQFDLKLNGFIDALAQRLLGEVKTAIGAKKFTVATAKLAELRAVPSKDAAVAKSIADAQANLIAAKKAAGIDWGQVGPVVGGLAIYAIIGTVVFLTIKWAAPYVASSLKPAFWSMVFTSFHTWFASLHWYGWVGVIVVVLLLIGAAQEGSKAIPAVLFGIWILLRLFGPKFDLDQVTHKPDPSLASPGYTLPKLPYTSPLLSSPSQTGVGSRADQLLHSPAPSSSAKQ